MLSEIYAECCKWAFYAECRGTIKVDEKFSEFQSVVVSKIVQVLKKSE